MAETVNYTRAPQPAAAVSAFLNRHGVSYQPVLYRELTKSVVLEAVLLSDDKGAVQVLLPASHLLDFDALKRVTGRRLTALPSDQTQRLLNAQELDRVPGVPGVLGLPLLVDQAVPDTGLVGVRAGGQRDWLQVQMSDLLQAVPRPQRGPLSHPAPRVEYEPDSHYMDLDVDAIEASVQRFTTKRIRQRLVETLEIPPLPDTAREIVRLRVDPDANIAKLSAIVEKDPSLAAQVISWASSSYYAAPGSIKSVQDAMVRVLGFDLVMNLTLGLAMGQTMHMPADVPQGITPYWQEALFTAELVAELHQRMPPEFQPGFGLSYLSGLLHNFGFLVLAHVFRPQFSTCCRLWEANPHLSPQAIERHVLGVDRDQIGASLLGGWNVPDEVCRATRFGNIGDYEGRYADYVHLVYLARVLLRRAGLVQGIDQGIAPSVLARLYLTPEAVRGAVQQVLARQDHLSALARGMTRAA